MNLKNYDINKINLKNNKIILMYGKNEGLKDNFRKKLIADHKNILSYDQNDILDNENIFFENLLSKSLFETEKIILVKRANDKLVKTIDKISEENLNEIAIIIDADNLNFVDNKQDLGIVIEKVDAEMNGLF